MSPATRRLSASTDCLTDRDDPRQARDAARAALYRFLDESWGRLPEPADLDRFLRLRKAFDAAQSRLDVLLPPPGQP